MAQSPEPKSVTATTKTTQDPMTKPDFVSGRKLVPSDGKIANPDKTPSSANVSSQPRKPFPWPLSLVLLSPTVLLFILTWAWSQQDHMLVFRLTWIALCSFLPGLSIMVVFGSLAQMRCRPFLSSLSLVFGGATLASCFWAVQKIAENAEALLK